jgi:DNA-binding IclR family transcriptional regulator
MRYSSVQNALRILDAFSTEETDFGIVELAEKLSLSNGTIHRLLTTLGNQGFIAQDPNTKRYHLGFDILSLGQVAAEQFGLGKEVRLILDELTMTTKESSNIGILDGKELVYIFRSQSPNPIRIRSHIGKRFPAYCTASGQLLLAHSQIDYREEELVPHTRSTITTLAGLKKRLEQIRQQKYAITVNELHDGVTSIAAPICNERNEVIASISITGPNQRLTDKKIPDLLKLTLLASKRISEWIQSNLPNRES